MANRTYTDEQKAAALKLYREVGACEAARQTEIPQKTISSWAKRSGVQSEAPEKTRAATEMAQSRIAERRAEAREKLADRIVELLDRINAPHTEFVGKDGRREMVSHATAEATRHYSISIGTLIDKLRLELGEATSREESIRKDRVDQEIERLLGQMEQRAGTRA